MRLQIFKGKRHGNFEHLTATVPADPMESVLETPRKAKMPNCRQFCLRAFSHCKTSFASFGRHGRVPTARPSQQNQQLDLVGGCNAIKSRDLEIWGCVRSPPPLPNPKTFLAQNQHLTVELAIGPNRVRSPSPQQHLAAIEERRVHIAQA